jgi:dihydroorotase
VHGRRHRRLRDAEHRSADDEEAALADKVKRATDRMHCDFAFWVGGTHENAPHVAELERLPGAAGIKVFMGSSTGSLLVEDDAGVASILQNTRRRSAFHSEDEYRLRERKGERDRGRCRAPIPVWRDETAALMCTERLVTASRSATTPRSTCCTSRRRKRSTTSQHHKDVATCEATPHHLTLVAPDCYERLGTLAQMNPPVRDARAQAGIWKGIAQGIVDVLGSDHAPHTLEEKQKTYPASPSGMTGVQTLVPTMLDHVAAGKLTLERFVDLTSAGPARIFAIAGKGRIAAGYDADFTVVDLKRRADHHQRLDRLQEPAGRPMTARRSPAGRSAPSSAAAASCGTRRSSRRARARRSSSRRRCRWGEAHLPE